MIAVLTCDIISSRSYDKKQRQILQTSISDAFSYTCKIIPEAKADYMSFSVIQGDEFQFNIEEAPYSIFFVYFRNQLFLC